MDDIKQLYRRKKWNDVKREIIARDNGRCQECHKLITGRFIIHHKTPATLDNFYDRNNLELVCQECHNKLTFHDDINQYHKKPDDLSAGNDLLPY